MHHKLSHEFLIFTSFNIWRLEYKSIGLLVEDIIVIVNNIIIIIIIIKIIIRIIIIKVQEY